MIFLLNCVAVGFCLESRCLGGLPNKLLKGGFLGLYLSVNTPMGVPLLLAQALFAERSVSKVTNIPINDHLGHHDEKHHDNHKLSSFTISILTIIITIASPGTSAVRRTLSIKVHHYQQDHITSSIIIITIIITIIINIIVVTVSSPGTSPLMVLRFKGQRTEYVRLD